MTDAHCHLVRNDATRAFLCTDGDSTISPKGTIIFQGCHPWQAASWVDEKALRARLVANKDLGVGEIGLDRLKEKNISENQRRAFTEQLKLAAEFNRAVVLHGAKCWGQVVKECKKFSPQIPVFLFHGFSRSDGLIPDIINLNGYISVGASILNDHAVNYRALVKKIPIDRLLIESDAVNDDAEPSLLQIASALSKVLEINFDDLARILEENATRFISAAKNKFNFDLIR